MSVSRSILFIEQPIMKRIISIIALWVIALASILFGRMAHADTFYPAYRELSSWQCQFGDPAECVMPSSFDTSKPATNRFLRVRVELDNHKKFYLIETKMDQRFFFSTDLARSEPALVQAVIDGCQFRSKDSFCTMNARINYGVVENIDTWSVHRFQVAK